MKRALDIVERELDRAEEQKRSGVMSLAEYAGASVALENVRASLTKKLPRKPVKKHG